MELAEVKPLLAYGYNLARADAERIVALGGEVVPILIETLESDETQVRCAAARLLWAIGDRRAFEPLVRCLESAQVHDDDDLGDEAEADVMGDALTVFGGDALAPLSKICLEQAHKARRPRCEALCALSELGLRDPLLRPLVAAELLQAMRAAVDSEYRSMVAESLIDLDWREAMDEVGAMGFDGTRQPLFERWKSERPRTFVPLTQRDPLQVFASPHAAALLALRGRVRKPSSATLRIRDEFASDLADWMRAASTSAATRRAPVGRNEPCPCGSGRKYKACCRERDEAAQRQHPAVARIARVLWRPEGYALLPSEQLAQLPVEVVCDHLDILDYSAAQVTARLARETDDYALWACCCRLAQLGRFEAAREVAIMVAASRQGHPALNYSAIEVRGLADIDPRSPEAFRESALRTALRVGELRFAWQLAEEEPRPERSAEIFVRIWAAWPDVLWTPVAMAEALSYEPDLVLPHLRRAHAMALEGRSASLPHPLDSEASDCGPPCPLEVIEGYLADLVLQAENQRRMKRMGRSGFGLSPELDRRRMNLLFDLRIMRRDPPAEAHREAHDAAVDEIHREAVQMAAEILAAAPASPVIVLLSPDLEGGGMLCVSSVPCSDGSPWALYAAVSRAAFEISPHANVEALDWDGWTAVRVSDCGNDSYELADLVQMSLEDAPDPPQFTCVEFIDGLPVREGTTTRQVDVELQPADDDEPSETLGLTEYLRRVLIRLVRMNKIGAAHTQEAHFFRGIPRSARGDFKLIFDQLVNEGYIRLKPTVTSRHISIEPRRLPEVLNFIDGAEFPSEALREVLGEVK